MSLITVKSKSERFRRAGLDFTRAGVEFDTDDLTQDQVDAIQAEPNLVIVGDAELVGGKKQAKGKSAAKKA